MVVCHCEAVNDASILRLVTEAGLDADVAVDVVRDVCGAGSRCGGCIATIRELVESMVPDSMVPVEVAGSAVR